MSPQKELEWDEVKRFSQPTAGCISRITGDYLYQFCASE